MIVALIAFMISMVLTAWVIRMGDRLSISHDHDLSGPQKFHAKAVPRIGGLSIFMAFLGGSTWLYFQIEENDRHLAGYLVLASLPAFLSGFTEDITKVVSARWRLIFTMVSAAIGIWLLDAVALRSGIPFIDVALAEFPVAVLVTLLAVGGVANAVNIIDGFNGLSSMCLSLMFLAIAYVAGEVGDPWVMWTAVAMAGAILGFFVWNFPLGLIFLGDGGAYFLGFMLAELSLLLVARNPEVSPMFAVLLCAYPIVETLFTIYRRWMRGHPVMNPDGIHLHTLIHRRVMRFGVSTQRACVRSRTRRNSLTSPYLWVLTLLSIIPAIIWWQSTAWVVGWIGVFILIYLWLYWAIVRFRTPAWLVIRSPSLDDDSMASVLEKDESVGSSDVQPSERTP